MEKFLSEQVKKKTKVVLNDLKEIKSHSDRAIIFRSVKVFCFFFFLSVSEFCAFCTFKWSVVETHIFFWKCVRSKTTTCHPNFWGTTRIFSQVYFGYSIFFFCFLKSYLTGKRDFFQITSDLTLFVPTGHDPRVNHPLKVLLIVQHPRERKKNLPDDKWRFFLPFLENFFKSSHNLD